jgi:hypothetical protein
LMEPVSGVEPRAGPWIFDLSCRKPWAFRDFMF